MYDKFVRDRITQLRLQKGVSEYQMSYDLGHSRGYIYNISSGKSLPPMMEFFAICDYFEIPRSLVNDRGDARGSLALRRSEADLRLVGCSGALLPPGVVGTAKRAKRRKPLI